jgi:beta-lactamase class A
MKNFTLVTLTLLVIICLVLIVWIEKGDNSTENKNVTITNTDFSSNISSQTQLIVVNLLPKEEKAITLNKDVTVYEKDLPSIVTYNKDLNTLFIKTDKTTEGEYFVRTEKDGASVIYNFKVRYAPVNWEVLESDLRQYLGTYLDQYGIYLHDLGRDKTISINGDVDFPPASMAKMTVALLVMRDIDAGKYSLATTYPIQDEVKFSDTDDLGMLINGTEVPLRTYLEKLIQDSNNTAWYHLIKFLGGSFEVVNQRTRVELGVDPIFLDPHSSTANQFGKLYDDLYHARSVSESSRDYLIDLMKTALVWNREGIGLGLPPNIEFANKIGYLWTVDDVNFVDSAIVYGVNTDYILIILNKDVDWERGKQRLEDISRIVYESLDV